MAEFLTKKINKVKIFEKIMLSVNFNREKNCISRELVIDGVILESELFVATLSVLNSLGRTSGLARYGSVLAISHHPEHGFGAV